MEDKADKIKMAINRTDFNNKKWQSDVAFRVTDSPASCDVVSLVALHMMNASDCRLTAQTPC